MIDRILVPMDGSEMSEHALEYALENNPNASVTVLYVAGEPSPMMGKAMRIAMETDVDEAAQEVAEAVFGPAREIASEYDAEIDTAVALGSPARQILDRAGDYDAVIMGSHGGGLQSTLLMGNVASKVSARAPVPVTLVR
ncbi:universal stress protein [Halapricum salinum]|uniref:Universal stress protein n=1 Tax=Halapricum salinum TaxID=1457250 RepID=A0A4D6H9H7_9EURY|nr:universal stress protein [Halapricum salinum]QCC50161.1 universal stress protein [Halapricum salinum]